jgi:hypothetical protein
MLQTMQWPGNIRQLRNVIERMLILGEAAARSRRANCRAPKEVAPRGRHGAGRAGATLPLREARELFEREYLLTQINRFGGNISRTANFVGMERSALHRKLKSLGVVTTTKSGARSAHAKTRTMAKAARRDRPPPQPGALRPPDPPRIFGQRRRAKAAGFFSVEISHGGPGVCAAVAAGRF